MGRARSLTVLLLLATLGLACHASKPAPTGCQTADCTVGGSRLKANYIVGFDGAAMPSLKRDSTFFDTVLQDDCRFERAGDGELRCMPANQAYKIYGIPFYSDAGCNALAFNWPVSLSNSIPPVMVVWDTSTCPGRVRHWKTGATIPASQMVYSRGAGGACGPDFLGDGQIHAVEGEVDYTTYVKAVQVDGAARSGYTPVRLLAEDGAVMPLGFKTAGSDLILQPLLASDGKRRLLPSRTDAHADYVPKYSDAACQTPAVQEAGSCPTVGPFASGWAWSPVGCARATTFYSVGAKLDSLYDTEWFTCSSLNVDGYTGFAMGAEVPAATFAEAVPVAATGRMVRPTSEVAPGWLWSGWTMVDTGLGVVVSPETAADGVERWLPDYTTWAILPASTHYFSDSACTTRLGPPPTRSACEADSWFFVECDTPYCSNAPKTVYPRRARHDGQVFENYSAGGPCVPSSSTGPWYEVGPAIPASAFAPVVLERR